MTDPASPPQLGDRFTDLSLRLKRREQPGIWHALTFASDWVNYTVGFDPAAYRRIDDTVELRGLIKKGTNPAVGSVITTLPVGYRPVEGTWLFPVIDAVTVSRVDMHTDGTLTWVAGNSSGVGPAGFMSLTTIRFSTAPILA